MKYMIASYNRVAEYYRKELGINKKDCKIITRREQLRGLRLNKEDIIIIDGKDFDYPIQDDEFYKIMRELPTRIIK